MLPQRLANAELTWVPVNKITDYLLNPFNPQAVSKPDDFAKMGYDIRNVDLLMRDLISVVQNNPPIERGRTPADSVTYRVEG